MKNNNTKGFTLIELLAVITILGILMLVAIPNITRTIENSRKDTFADVAQAYINAVKNEAAANSLECCSKTTCPTFSPYSEIMSGTFYIFLQTEDDGAWTTQTKDLMESGGKSSWSNADVGGFVKVVKEPVSGGASKSTYYVHLADSAGHGIDSTSPAEDQHIERSEIHTSGITMSILDPENADLSSYGDNDYLCQLIK